MDVRIGITTSFKDGEQILNYAYVKAVEAAGGLPLIVPMMQTEAAALAFAQMLDGLVITGGPAVTQGLIGALPEDIADVDPIRDRSDRLMIEAFLKTRKPVLGICYGMQLLNAVAGGTIYADVEQQMDGATTHQFRRGGKPHPMDIVEGSHLHRIFGETTLTVNTRHIQALADVGAPYTVSARAPDGVVEAIEDATGTILGVQFHPERMGAEMHPLFSHLVDRARQHRLQPLSGV